jgi:hypothetical protein
MDDIARLAGKHYPVKTFTTERAKRAICRRAKKCRVCYARGVRANKGGPLETIWVFGDCPSKPGLHIDVRVVLRSIILNLTSPMCLSEQHIPLGVKIE